MIRSLLVVAMTQFWVLLCTSLCSFGQMPKHISNFVSGAEYEPKQFTQRVVNIFEAAGVYHFGDSEGEWDFVIQEHKGKLIVQAWDGYWAKDTYTHRDCWQKRCRTFNHANVKGSYLYFGKYKGMFTLCKDDGKSKKALLLFVDVVADKGLGRDEADIGFYQSDVKGFYSDKELYQLSLAVLPETYFKNKTKQELKIMRNTVYAKYGYLFQPGGEMEQCFKKKEWYHPYLKDVSDCLTVIEQENIQTVDKLMKEN